MIPCPSNRARIGHVTLDPAHMLERARELESLEALALAFLVVCHFPDVFSYAKYRKMS